MTESKTITDPLTPDYLREYSKEHLWYEVFMFFQPSRVRLQSTSRDIEVLLTNILIDASVLHLRNLLDFFYSEPRRTDVSAAMFYDTQKLPTSFPVESEALKKAHRRAHKEVNHLTTERLWPGDPEKNWNFDALRQEIAPVLKTFVETASPERLHPDFVLNATELLK